MTLFERLKELSKKRGKNLKQVALELGYGENLFYTWKKSAPNSDKLQEVADYFNVTTDYLLGRDTTEMQHLDPEEDELLVMFRKNTAGMNDDEKREFNESLDKLMSVAKDLFERDKKK
ncbi:helix-turn-helix domain-containing protein [Enterococcus faecalis]|uniref:Transcriptional regulator n=1 Tax=Enterococcus faecalis TaxID=1351 RepID=A0AC59HU20_ENTFL|nr:helix-turn-helix transcriptional regulator [Enterococcus faecalis]MDR0027125.1 helix-turn-helix transcriptional regulator [Enterococcus faecalis]UKV08022.1 helix-turn-helix transcriptional regulator [Enterococcus faecalis]BDQ47508.1 transcriptional regulator [Enterococcus faecalis]BDQ51740.1 transcriptional regulator [Enterococcus faecalis]BDQ58343.1 transcriptional regulator [Enterococcus faecalis]